MSIDTIKADFEFLDDWEDRYRYVIELGRELEPLSTDEKTETTRVRGCASQVWLVVDTPPGDPSAIHFRGESDAHIVQGLIAIIPVMIFIPLGIRLTEKVSARMFNMVIISIIAAMEVKLVWGLVQGG